MKIGFYSCMTGMPWGGSEVLWQRAARVLQNEKHQVTVNFKWWPNMAFQLQQIEKHGGTVWLRDQHKTRKELRREKLRKFFLQNPEPKSWLKAERPDVVLITLGYHPDPLQIADECLELGIPYGINLQCASDFFFIHSDRMEEYRRWYQNAQRVFFVSTENQEKLEKNIAFPLENSEIVANPFNVSYDAKPDWPATDDGFRLAVVGRIHFQSKGQDIIVDVMKQPKWRERNLKVRFYGHDQGNSRQLLEMIRLNQLEDQLTFEGFSKNVEEIWADNHALLLPSRYEGAPLAFIEAMLCQRIAITTDIGRNRELMTDNESGFLAAAAKAELIDDAMERAWQQRDRWQEMGQLAGKQIRERYPADPIREYADKILALKPESRSS